MKFRKKPIIIEATQWFALGDHPKVLECWFSEDGSILHFGDGPEAYKEICTRKSAAIKTLEGWHEVWPGDWIVTDDGSRVVKPEIFTETYELAEPIANTRGIFTEPEVL